MQKAGSALAIDPDRIDDNGLTGCLTILNSVLRDVEIHSTNANCEDAINIFGSSGSIKKISSFTSKFDALDVDFVDLSIDNIKITGAGNDCLDLSGSKIILATASLAKCGDKGISVGEESTLSADEIFIQDSQMGIASKDSSNVVAENVAMKSTDKCFATYQKSLFWSRVNRRQN